MVRRHSSTLLMPGDGWIDVTDNNARLPSYLAVGLPSLVLICTFSVLASTKVDKKNLATSSSFWHFTTSSKSMRVFFMFETSVIFEASEC